ncbi:organic hydroperoxide resistance protein [Uliginosibacterium gangwonense]|uniref:organic hydroperoxide resistance protein n=1 Tax=Uliginosibacterium gangwonense TaxID=392736 RepID=UPI000371372D|nr:organic hydroperoxide resistance protein [Uliginosibacterium gangwonense]
MKQLYTTRAIANGGRNGKVRTEDGVFATDLAMPRELGGTGKAPNPEQLFAAGYAACFENAVLHIARLQKLPVRDTEVAADVALNAGENGAFVLSVALHVSLAGLDQAAAEALVAQAHQVCPYSNATRGNIEVTLTTLAKA